MGRTFVQIFIEESKPDNKSDCLKLKETFCPCLVPHEYPEVDLNWRHQPYPSEFDRPIKETTSFPILESNQELQQTQDDEIAMPIESPSYMAHQIVRIAEQLQESDNEMQEEEEKNEGGTFRVNHRHVISNMPLLQDLESALDNDMQQRQLPREEQKIDDTERVPKVELAETERV